MTTQALDAAGHEVSKFTGFSQVRLTNTNDMPVAVRVVCIVWDQPAPGDTQQADEVTPVRGLTLVPAQGTAVVKVTGSAASAVARSSGGPAVSIKVFQSQQAHRSSAVPDGLLEHRGPRPGRTAAGRGSRHS